MIKKPYLFICVLSAVLLMLSKGYSLGLNISATKVYIEIEPGKNYEGFIDVSRAEKNIESYVEAEINDWKYNDKSQMIENYPINSQKDSCSTWLAATPTKFTLSDSLPQVKVHYTIAVPADLADPEYYSVLYFRTMVKNPDEKNDTVGLKIEAKIAVIFKLTVKGKGISKAEIESFVVKENKERKNYELVYSIKNSGNTLLITEGSYNIIDVEGNLYGRGAMSRSGVSVGSVSDFKDIWNGELKKGEYDFIITFQLNGRLEDVLVAEYHMKKED
jgi:hypothetical protein